MSARIPGYNVRRIVWAGIQFPLWKWVAIPRNIDRPKTKGYCFTEDLAKTKALNAYNGWR